MKKWIVIGAISIFIFIATFFFYGMIPKPDGRYEYIERLYNKDMLIGLTIEECREKLGDEYHLFDSEKCIAYDAGQTRSSFKGMTTIKDYAIEVYFDENGVAIDNILKQRP